MNLNVVNETNKLKKVVLGIANNLGEVPLPSDCIDPKTKHYLINGEYPLENNCIAEIENFNNILIDNGVSVIRPKPITDLNQIFTRDIAFVIDNIIFEANTIDARAEEKNGILDILNNEKGSNKIQIPKGIKIEGGDVIIMHGDVLYDQRILERLIN